MTTLIALAITPIKSARAGSRRGILQRGSISPGLEIRVCKSANVRRADKDTVPVGLSYVYAGDNRFLKDPDFQSG